MRARPKENLEVSVPTTLIWQGDLSRLRDRFLLVQLCWLRQVNRFQQRTNYSLRQIASTVMECHLHNKLLQPDRLVRTHHSQRTHQVGYTAFGYLHRCNQLDILRYKTCLSHQHKARQLCRSRGVPFEMVTSGHKNIPRSHAMRR